MQVKNAHKSDSRKNLPQKTPKWTKIWILGIFWKHLDTFRPAYSSHMWDIPLSALHKAHKVQCFIKMLRGHLGSFQSGKNIRIGDQRPLKTLFAWCKNQKVHELLEFFWKVAQCRKTQKGGPFDASRFATKIFSPRQIETTAVCLGSTHPSCWRRE